MASLFTKIINGEIPCHKIAENDHCLAFLDIFPVSHGHVVVIPKKEVDKFYHLDDADYSHLMLFAKKIAVALEKAIPCTRIGMSVIGLEVPHAHVHLVPINEIGDLNFSKPKLTLEDFELKSIAEKIRAHID